MYHDRHCSASLLRFLPLLPAAPVGMGITQLQTRTPAIRCSSLVIHHHTRCHHRDATTLYLCCCHPRRYHRRRSPYLSSHPSYDLTGADSCVPPVQDSDGSGGAAQPAHTPPLAASLLRHSIGIHRGIPKLATQSDFHFGFTLFVGNQDLSFVSARIACSVLPYTSFSLSRLDIYPAISVTRALTLARPLITQYTPHQAIP